VQFADFLLDRLIAPEFSTLTSFSLPDLPELPNYYDSYFLNNVFRSEFEDKARPLAFSMLRHLTQGIREYRNGRIALAEFGKTTPHSNDAITLYLRALTHFEHAIIHCDLAIGLSHAVARCIDASMPKRHFKQGENSPEERLRFLYNAVKHFDDIVVKGKLPNRAAPVWMVTEGLRCIFEEKKDKPPAVKTLQFKEMAAIFTELAGNAAFLAEEVCRLAHERQAAKIGRSEERAE
jgi:hypothetical protein